MPTRWSRVAESASDALAYIGWVEHLLWRSALDLAPGDASWDEIAAAIGIEAPRLVPGDTLPSDLATAQLYWPLPTTAPAARPQHGEQHDDDDEEPQGVESEAAEDQRQDDEQQE